MQPINQQPIRTTFSNALNLNRPSNTKRIYRFDEPKPRDFLIQRYRMAQMCRAHNAEVIKEAEAEALQAEACFNFGLDYWGKVFGETKEDN